LPEDFEHTVVFADEDDPFNNPIIGIDLFTNSGWVPWSANLDPDDARMMAGMIKQVDEDVHDRWTIDPASGLTMVASFDDLASENLLRYGWQFNFSNGAERASIQALANPADPEAGEWAWIRLALRGTDAGSTVSTVELFGQDAVRIELVNDRLEDELIWFDDGFAYRVLASRLSGDQQLPASTDEVSRRLQLVDRADWLTAIRDVDRTTPTEFVLVLAAALLALVALASLLFLTFTKHWKSVGILLATVAVVMLAGSPGVSLLAMILVGTTGAWWSYRLDKASVST